MEEAEERYQETLAFLRKAWTSGGRFSHHGKYWHYEDVVIEPAPVQKPHPPFWIGAASPNSIRYAAEQGYNLLLGQGGGPDTVAEGVSIYRRAVEAQGRAFDTSMVGLTRALHIAMNENEREAALALRAKFMAQVEELSLSPTGESPSLGRPRKGADVGLSRRQRRQLRQDRQLRGPQRHRQACGETLPQRRNQSGIVGFKRGDKPVQRYRTRSRHDNDGGIGDPRFGAQHGL